MDSWCVEYGFCHPPLGRARLERNPPRPVDTFLETVFRAEGLDPALADSRGQVPYTITDERGNVVCNGDGTFEADAWEVFHGQAG